MAAPDPDAAGAPSLAAAAAQDELFTEVAQPRLNPRQEALLGTIRSRPATAEVRIARLAAAPAARLRRGAALGLTVAPGKRFVAVGERVTERGPDNVSWGGKLRSEGGEADLVLSGDGVTGAVRGETEAYEIEPLGGGLHAIVRVDPAKLPPEHPVTHPAGALVVPPHAQTAVPEGPRVQRAPSGGGGTGGIPDPTAQHHGGPDIDVLVVYTPSAASAHGNIGSLAQLAVDLANTSYGNSNVYAHQVLVHTAQVSYTEGSGSHQDHLNRLQNWSDGVMDNANSLRNQYLADVVVLIVNDSEACGLASAIRASGTQAWAVVHYSCIASNYSFAHEIGHLQGARHDRAVDSNTSPFAWGHGFIAPGNAWRTIMAYPNACSNCTRVNYWSNSYVTYPGTTQPMGTTNHEDNARVLNYTKYDVRDFRAISPPYGLTVTNEYSYGDYPHFTWSRVPGAWYHTIHRCVTTAGYYYDSCFYGVGGDEGELVDLANWRDYDYTLAPSWNGCSTTAMYRVTATDRTGESGWTTQISLCVQ
ncbi:MAG TPA: M12 family metallo-peptidase [Longimicrobium sp.]|nr:M12 family metallo-peptidase [Longimicrobium sp.]